MGVPDYDLMFDLLDLSSRGYLTVTQLQDFQTEVYFSPLDVRQIDAAITTVCGREAEGICTKEHFGSVVEELGRRVLLEESVEWDFKCLDVTGCGRISLSSALLLFKCVHGENFSLQTWERFLSTRPRSYLDVSFDEIKLWLCNLPTGGPCDDEEFLGEKEKVEIWGDEESYEEWNELEILQEDNYKIAEREAVRNHESTKLKQKSKRRIRRLEKDGIDALLYDGESEAEDDEGQKEHQQIGASDLLAILKSKYEILREKLLVEMTEHELGEGMWSALSESEREERLDHTKLKERRLSVKEGSIAHSHTSSATIEYKTNLFALLGYGRLKAELIFHEENEKRSKLEDEGKTESEIHDIFQKDWKELLTGQVDSDTMLREICCRYQQEKELIKGKIRGDGDVVAMTISQRLQEFKLLYREQLKASLEQSFESAGLVIGVAETATNANEIDRFHFAKDLQEQLAERRLSERRGHKLQTEFTHPQLDYHVHEGGIVEHFEDVIKALERKHRAEIEMMVQMLQGKDSSQTRSEARKMTSEERDNQFLVLKTQREGWRNRSSEEKIETKSFHLGLLQEAVSIVYVNKRLEMKDSVESDRTIAIMLLAKLLQKQETDARMLLAMKEQTSDELLRIRQEQEQIYREQWLDNLSAVILGTSDVTQLEDDIIKLLEEKYDSIREKVLEEALRDQTGANEWENTPDIERYNLITKAKASEKKCRLRKKFSGALKLLGEGFMSSEKIMSHLGENRQVFVEELKAVLEKRRNHISEGLEPESMNYGIEERVLKNSGNLWQDLDERYKSEKRLLLQWLQEGGNGTREVSDVTVRLQQQKRLTEQEPNMLCALLIMGLYERHRRADNERLTQDDSRRRHLAEEHFILARLRGTSEEKVEDSEPNKDVLSEWMDAVLREVERKHRMERHFLTSLMLDNALEDLRSEAREMTEDERQKRFLELKDERDVLDFDEKGDQDMNHTILEMACAFKVESRRFRLQSVEKESRVTDDVVFVSLVTDLHQRHNDQCEEILEDILDKSKEELATIRVKHIQSYKSEYMDNVASILMTYDGLGTNEDILSALENKYDALRDKLLLDALRKQLGEDEWKRLSEKERQLRLMKLKLEAKRLRRENKLEELAKLLGEGFAADINLKKLLGENRDKYEQQLRERLARRRERLTKGLPAEDNEDNEDEEDSSNETIDGKSLLENIERRFEEERDALMAKLLGANNQFLSERERQALLARLKREQMKARLEEKFGTAALVLGLAERQRKDAEERFMSDRARHEELAGQRLVERRNKKNKKSLGDEDIVTEGDSGVLQEAVLKMLENKHMEEREVLIALLENDDNNLHDLAQSMTPDQREEHITNLKIKKNDLDKDDKEMHREILQESAIMKFTSRQRNLELQKTGETISKNAVVVSLLADLQQEQDKESEILLALLPDKDKTELITLQTRLLSEAQSDVRPNLMTVFGTPEQITSVGEEQLVDALDSKYDTLRDKLLSEALMKEMGAAEWQALSEQERQARLVKIKLEERRLRKEGKMDELQALLGAAFDAEANLKDLMGQNKARYKERMREKLEKRRQRMKEGMSKEDVASLEAEEDQQFEDEMKEDANVNPLLKLMQCYDKEKEALLAALRNKDARFSSERQRQAELARLRREERKARLEDKFDTAALVLGLAQAQKANLEELQKKDRLRQEQLARDRLAARRKKNSENLQNKLREKEQEQLDEISDKENLVALQEAMLKEMEKKQECEREFLEKLLQEEEKSKLRENTQEKSEEQRTERLIELKDLREQWRESRADGTEESEKQHEEILREAVCLNSVATMAELKANSSGGEVKQEDVQVAILANLQQIQDQESEILLRDLSSKAAITLTQLRAVHHQAKRYRWYDNIAVSLLGMKTHMRQPDREDVPSEEALLNALEEKYDALKDKLIAESLMSDLGAAEWGNLSEQERQARILKIRLQEKKLRREGKVDEANRLFGEGLEHAANLSKLMGETKSQQKDALRRRLQKLRELKAAGIEMTTEEAELLEDKMEEGAIDEEVSTEDVMKDLQARYEEEKKALLASLSGQDKRFSSERQRQLELARLRREQKKIAKEDKFDAAALVLGLAKQQEATRDASYRKDRARHEQLARERLAALKAKRAEKGAAQLVLETEDAQREVIETKLREEQENEKNSLPLEALEIQKGGMVAVHEAVLREVEKKHSIEIKMLSELIDVSEVDSEAVAAASYLNEKQRDEKMADLYNDYKNWKTATVTASKNAGSDHAITKEEKEQDILRKADNQMKLMGILKDGIVLKVLNLKEQLSARGIPESVLKDELGVLLVANLQEKQNMEGRAVENILAEKDEETLSRVKDDQRRIRQECIVDNLASVVLQKYQDMAVEDSNEVAQMKEENVKQLAEMEAELQEAKRQRLMTGASEADIMAALDEIKKQQEAKKQAMNASLERQRNLARAKLEAKRRRRDDKQYEEDIATSLLMMAEQESTLVREKTVIQRSKQGESLQERLAKRREERAKRKAQEEMEKNGDGQESEGDDSASQGTTASGEHFVVKTAKLKDRKPSLPDGFRMKREKSVVDVLVSEDKKKEIVGSLLREHTTFGMGFERERKRQEEIMRERRMKKKSTVVEVAAHIIGLGERQKTMVEQKRKEERDRQMSLVRDRINRVRYERTMTMMEPKTQSESGFDHILSEEEAQGLSGEDKMKLIAARMEEKFKVEEMRATTTVHPPVSMPAYSAVDDEDLVNSDMKSSVRLDEKGKEKKLKERFAARKKRKADRGRGTKENTGDTGESSSTPLNDQTSTA